MSNNHTRFDRHENMNPETVKLVMELTEQVGEKPVSEDGIRLRNFIFGLLDGYLYNEIPELTDKVFNGGLGDRLSERAIKSVYAQCKEYPKI